MITARTRAAYRQLLGLHGVHNVPEGIVNDYIRIQRVRLAIFTTICVAILGAVIYIWVR